ncbi:hypothetical protein E3Q22_03965 [Wallemia mellicola]|uniref:Ribosomal protein bL31m N-terminal domain-containing protein n=2 Tax=Wallemia mellicola TaxID=1708541 RepID=A0A4T0PC02_9BASI|nr:hypothetical protein E3Q24_03875 [Wallemia mellicola]TIB73855.1 hypothetical protein E3Q23_02884 [Wallemia mellicola]TIB75519.1 hypothetical protein E3Q22_03965 [Wallemia mellicola]TIB79978.1 hypothetical protein E3Q21_03959 [Wallemia mellicola]TIB83964.1 hypothetical protein E3Q20_03908 [Wallemia mellicola]
MHRTIARLASTKAQVLPPPTIPHFEQKVQLSDGSTISMFTTSPRSVIKSSKDTGNHAVWNPQSVKLTTEDESGRLTRFAKRFGLQADQGPEKGRLERQMAMGGFGDSDLQSITREATDMEKKVQAKPDYKPSPKKKKLG